MRQSDQEKAESRHEACRKHTESMIRQAGSVQKHD